MTEEALQDWPIRLFKRSVLKQRKFNEVTAMLGPTDGLTCLDIGGDNGVISYLLRQRGGTWMSADLDAQSVNAIQELVKTDVYQLDGNCAPFQANVFNRVAIVDYLEHIPDDDGFLADLHRVMKPGGIVVINVPHIKKSALRKLRITLGQTDAKHGHLRPGYTIDSIKQTMDGYFTCEEFRTYSKFFSELIDTLIVLRSACFRKANKDNLRKDYSLLGSDIKAYQNMFRAYSGISSSGCSLKLDNYFLHQWLYVDRQSCE
jgi:ubiquinone/menaquinone biosynthesis C-methylase UbiE